MSLPRHAPMTQWPVVDDCLIVGNLPLTHLAERVGRTPFYAYDRRLLTERVALLRSNLPSAIKLHYAMKANPMPALVGHLARLVDGIDVASGGELTLALDTGMKPAEISFAGPGKSEAELAQAIAAGILLNVESPREVEAVARLARAANLPARVAVRVNPDFELKSSGMKMGGGPKQFGVDAEAVPDLLREIGRLGLGFEGFHIFSGSQNLKAEAICDAQQKTLELAIRLAASAPSPVRVLNIGGGFGIPYFPGRAAARPGADRRQSARHRATRGGRPAARPAADRARPLPGRRGGHLRLSRRRPQGLARPRVPRHRRRPAPSSGGVRQLRPGDPQELSGRHRQQGRGTTREMASVVGPLCTPLDLLADQMDLAEAHPGDLVVVFQSGAYGMTASPQAFLSHPPALEVLV